MLGITFLPTAQKMSCFKKESWPLHFHFTFFRFWKLHLQSVRWETMILWSNAFFSLQNLFLIDFWSFHRKYMFPLTRHILIMPGFQPEFPSCIHICQKSLTIHWMMIKLQKHTILLLHNTIHNFNSTFWMLNRLISCFFSEKQYRPNTDTISQSVSYAQNTSSAKIMKTIAKMTIKLLNQLKFERRLISSNKLKN